MFYRILKTETITPEKAKTLAMALAHGFCVISERAAVIYKCTDYYAPSEERGIRWDDPALGINWPVSDPIGADKDQAFPFLAE